MLSTPVLPRRPGTTLHFVSFGLPKVRRCRRVAERNERAAHVLQGFRLVDCPGIPSRHQAELEMIAGPHRAALGVLAKCLKVTSQLQEAMDLYAASCLQLRPVSPVQCFSRFSQ